MSPGPLQNKVFLITGGTSALGAATVLKALAAGAQVYFTYRQHQEKAKELASKGAVSFPLDLSKTAAIGAFVKTFKEKEKALDVLIHNAAVVRDKTLGNMEEADWDEVLAVNLKAPFYLTKKLLPLLFKRKPSKVFMITSRIGVTGGFGVANYAASKAGMIGLTKSLAKEVGRKKILVNALNPGFMLSGMTRDLPQQVHQRNRELSPLGEMSNPEEVADFLCYLSSDAMTQVTGQVFHFESRSIP